nr:Gag-Pol polyprotein [Tanacetum cinerariifolium]
MPASLVYDRYQLGEGYHAVLPPYTGTFMPPKPDLVFLDAPTVNETVHNAFNVELSPTKPDKDLSHTHRPSAPIIEDWVSDSDDESKAEPTQNAPSFVQLPEHVKTSRPSVKPVEHPILADNLRKDSPKFRGHNNSGNTKACFVCKSLTHLIKDCDYYEKQIIQKPARNHAQRGYHQHYARLTHPNPQRHVVPIAVLTRSKLVPLHAARPVITAVPQPHVTRPRLAKNVVTKLHSPLRRTINRSSSSKPSNFPSKVTIVKALKGTCPFFMTLKLSIEDMLLLVEIQNVMCDKKNSVLFTYTKCIVLSFDFKLPDENHVMFKVHRENNMYNVDLKNIVPTEDLTCLFAKATLDESNLWHRRLGHINFKTMNKLVKGNLVGGLPSKVFENNHSCVACKKGKKHRASFLGIKGIKREFSIARTPQQNGIAERKNVTLIEAAKTMLADSLLPISFWAEAVNIACYVQNRVLVTKPHNKTPYELLHGRTPSIGFMKPFGCPVTILNTLDPLGKFDGKVDDGFLVGYSISSNAFRVFNITARNQPNPSAGIQEQFYEEKAGEENVQQYVLFPLWSSSSKDPQNTDNDTTFEVKELEFEGKKPESEVHVSPSNSAKTKKHDVKTKREAKGKSPVELSTGFRNLSEEFEDFSDGSTNEVNATSTLVPAVGQISTNITNTFSTTALEHITYSDDEEDVGAEADFSNLETTITEEGIDYEEVFAPVVRIEAIRLFLAYASFMGFMVNKMDVKSAFLYGTIEEKVYVCQPPGFEDPDYPDKVHKVVKALYGLHQAPRAWYETLAKYLLENGFQRGKIDQTLFIKKQKGDIL